MRNRKTVNIEKYLFCISYFLFLAYSFFGHIDVFGNTLKYLTDFSLAIIVFAFILGIKSYKRNDLFRLVIILIFASLCVFMSNDFLLFKLILILIISKNLSFDSKVKYDFILRVFFLIIMGIMYVVGIAPDAISYENGVLFHSLGFTNPNVFALHTFILCLELLYISRESLSIIKILIACAIMIWCNSVSGSRTALYMFFFSTLLFILYRYHKKIYINKLIKKIIIYSPIITSLIVLISYILYINNVPLGIQLDELMSSRLARIAYFLDKVPITLFGTDMSLFVDKSCDIAVVYSLFTFGIVGCLLYNVLFVRLFKKLYREEEICIVVIMFILVVYGLSERLWLNADYNILITSFSYLVFNNNNGVKRNEKRID